MKNIPHSCLLVLLFILPILIGCDKKEKNAAIIQGIVSNIQDQKQVYFHVVFQLNDVKEGHLLHQLQANASLKKGKYGSISKAFFTLEGEDKLHYLHTISDYQNPIYLLESTELDQQKAAIINDSIHNIVLRYPELLNEWHRKSEKTIVNNHEEIGVININFSFEQKEIELSWNKKEQRLIAVDIMDKNQAYAYKWSYKPLDKLAYEKLTEIESERFANQRKEFL